MSTEAAIAASAPSRTASTVPLASDSAPARSRAAVTAAWARLRSEGESASVRSALKTSPKRAAGEVPSAVSPTVCCSSSSPARTASSPAAADCEPITR